MTKDIIKFESITEREDGTKLISARELHEKLGLCKAFTTWIKQYVKEDNEYFFIDGKDFNFYSEEKVQNEGNRIIKRDFLDYAITLSMAKEICMVTKNEKGKICRKYFIDLENDVKQLEMQNKQLTEIAESDEEREERIRKANIINYSVYNIRKRLLECDYTNIEATVNKIIEIHANMYVSERDKPYQNTKKYGNKGSSLYVNHIRAIIETKLDEIRPQMPLANPNMNSIILEINRNIHKDIESSKNITSGREVNKLRKQLETLNPSIEKYLNLDVCGFSFNKMYKYVTGNRIKKSKDYNDWLYNFPYDTVAEYFKDVDLSKPTILFTKYVAPASYDIDNFIKSTQDAIASSLGCSDNKIHKVSAERIGDCKTTTEGKIFVYLRNITAFEMKQLKEIEKKINC